MKREGEGSFGAIDVWRGGSLSWSICRWARRRVVLRCDESRLWYQRREQIQAYVTRSIHTYIHTSGTTRRNPTNRFAHIYIQEKSRRPVHVELDQKHQNAHIAKSLLPMVRTRTYYRHPGKPPSSSSFLPLAQSRPRPRPRSKIAKKRKCNMKPNKQTNQLAR